MIVNSAFWILAALLLGLTGRVGRTQRTYVKKFSDYMLPGRPSKANYYEGIGNVRKLDTVIPPLNIERFKTKFHLTTSRGEMHDITYIPVQTHDDTHHFDLNRMRSSGFNTSAKTVVLVPGYLTSGAAEGIVEAAKPWSQLDPTINIIYIDWAAGNGYTYSRAVADTTLVSRQITIFLYYLYALEGEDVFAPEVAKRIHYVGHSLGAHIGGFVGQDFGGRLGRITGLDPAGPSFDQYSRDERLDDTDALFVDAIHTNAGKIKYLNACLAAPLWGSCWLGSKLPIVNRISSHVSNQVVSSKVNTTWYGINHRVGHLDYYANDGSLQPGCKDMMHICDHSRAYQIFVDILRREATFNGNRSRLMALRADSYEQLKYGAHPYDQRLYNLNGDTEAFLRSNAVPIDFVTPPEQLRSELTTYFGVNFNQPEANGPYYFSTSDGSQKSLVSVGLLLVVDLSLSGPGWPMGKCMQEFQLKVIFPDNVETTVEIGPLYTSRVFAMITHPNIERAHDILDAYSRLASNDDFQTRERIVRDFMPREFILSSKGKVGVFRAATNLVSKSAGWFAKCFKGECTSVRECDANMRQIQVIPIDEPGDFYVIYSSSNTDIKFKSRQEGV